MKTRFIFVTGGVVSSLGKGITASSIGRILKNRGLKVFMQKFDPYINVDPGTMSPYQHGEVFVTADGAETDLDLGHYERFIDENLTRESNITTGKIYQTVIEKERQGVYEGATVQVIPHITNEIKDTLKIAAERSNADVIITEIGGTVGDIESLPFLEAIRQARREFGHDHTFYLHNTLVPYLKAAKEIKTKPTQHSVKELRSLGIQPDMIVLRTEQTIDDDIKEKIALFCDVAREAVVEAVDHEVLYEVVNHLHAQGVDDYILNHFNLEAPAADLKEWNCMINRIKAAKTKLKIALVGKYVSLRDAYLSIGEALKHAGYYHGQTIQIKWINAEKVSYPSIGKVVEGCDGILVPGGFGKRASEGKIAAIRYARENDIPYFGICFGMQLAAVEFARNVCHLDNADSTEFNPASENPIIHLLPDQYEGIELGGTLRLGHRSCKIIEDTKAYEIYGETHIEERHRHRYEFNNAYKQMFKEHGMVFSAIHPPQSLVELLELPDKQFFVACQFHPEFSSRPDRPHPLFREFIAAAVKHRDQQNRKPVL